MHIASELGHQAGPTLLEAKVLEQLAVSVRREAPGAREVVPLWLRLTLHPPPSPALLGLVDDSDLS